MSLPKSLAGVKYSGATDYNVQISFLSAATPDNMGNVATATEVFATVWAKVRAVPITRGGALLKTDQVVQRAFYNITIRFLAGLNESMLVLCNGQQLQIDTCGDVDGHGVELHLVCSEVDQSL